MPLGHDRRFSQYYEFIVLAGVILALRIGYAIVLSFDSDEPQHLHVVWAWATGRLPYRDVFDNHAPLFQFLCAPLFRLIPERPDIVIPMRWAMLPLYGFALYAVFRLGAVFYPRKLALLIAVSGSLIPAYFLKSVEFRPDDLWAVVWFLALALLMEGEATVRRAFQFGLWLGVSFAISMKTTLFVLAAGVALAIVLGVKLFDKSARVDWKRLAQCLGVATLGVLIVPAVVVSYFYLRGIPGEFYYGVIEHNIVPHLKRWQWPGYLQMWFPLTLLGLIGSAALLYWRSAADALRNRRVFTFLIPGCYVLVLYGFWPDIPHEDDLPLFPLIPLACCLLVLALPPKWVWWCVGCAVVGYVWLWYESVGLCLVWLGVVCVCRFGWWWFGRERIQRLAWAVIVVQIAWLLVTRRPWERENRTQIATIAKMLQLTRPDEYVMDAKAGAIYRQRPFFYALETITRTRLKIGMIPDTIRQRMIETGTKVAALDALLDYSKTRGWVMVNYLPLKQRRNVRVIGKLMTKDNSTTENVFHFNVVIPAKYSIVDPRGRVAGILDGNACSGAVDLAVGRHEFRPVGSPTELALFWERALEMGYEPEFPDSVSADGKSASGG